METDKKIIKRRDKILWRLRKKGIRVLTKQCTVFHPYGENPEAVLQVRQLRSEYYFTVQFEIV
jgi:hypothetical protein